MFYLSTQFNNPIIGSNPHTTRATMSQLKTHHIANPSVSPNLKNQKKSPRGQPYIQCGKKIGDEKKNKKTKVRTRGIS